MHRVYILMVILLVQLSACTVKKMQRAGYVMPEGYYTKVPFDTYKGVIAIEVTIDEKKKKFLLDTGADLSLVQRDSLIGKTSRYSGASKREMELGSERVPKMQIGEVGFVGTYAVNGDLVGLKEQVPNFGGLIGQSIIGKANWLIDYPNKYLEISDRNLSDSTFQKIPIIRQNGNNPYTYLIFEGKRFKVVIDFGSSSVLNLPRDSKFAKIVSESIILNKNLRERYTLGGLQKIEEEVGEMAEVQIGEFIFKGVEVNINTSSQARIGIRFFKGYQIYIDNTDNGQFYLKYIGGVQDKRP